MRVHYTNFLGYRGVSIHQYSGGSYVAPWFVNSWAMREALNTPHYCFGKAWMDYRARRARLILTM